MQRPRKHIFVLRVWRVKGWSLATYYRHTWASLQWDIDCSLLCRWKQWVVFNCNILCHSVLLHFAALNWEMISAMVENIKKAQKSLLTLSSGKNYFCLTSNFTFNKLYFLLLPLVTLYIYCKGMRSSSLTRIQYTEVAVCSWIYLFIYFFYRSASWSAHTMAPGRPCQVAPPLTSFTFGAHQC